MKERPQVTQLLGALAEGDLAAQDRLFALVYDELKRIARGQVRRSGAYLGVNPTTLLHEAWIKFARVDDVPLQGSVHFYNLLAQAMRQILIDMAKRHATEKHGGALVRTELNENLADSDRSAEELLAVDAALHRLAAVDPELAQLVEWHFFGGLSFVEIAAARGQNERTVRRHWDMARALLAEHLGHTDGAASA